MAVSVAVSDRAVTSQADNKQAAAHQAARDGKVSGTIPAEAVQVPSGKPKCAAKSGRTDALGMKSSCWARLARWACSARWAVPQPALCGGLQE